MAAAPLPPGMVQFLDANGNPVALGTVGHYEPGGLTAKTTWQDYAQQAQNDNPLTLDEAGRATIWGVGRYRQIVLDAQGNQVWDKETLGALDVTSNNVVCDGVYEGDAPPVASAFLDGHVLPANVQWAADFAGSGAHVQSTHLPTSTYVVSIQLNDSQIGTLTYNTDGTHAFATTSVTRTANKDDRITFIGPVTPDVTINQFFWALILTVVS